MANKIPEFMRDGWRSLGRGLCACPDCRDAVSTNALARASHRRGCKGSVEARLAHEADAKLINWFKTEFRRRSDAVKAGTARIDWIDKGTRISWTEVAAKADQLRIKRNAVDLRTWFNGAMKSKKETA